MFLTENKWNFSVTVQANSELFAFLRNQILQVSPEWNSVKQCILFVVF